MKKFLIYVLFSLVINFYSCKPKVQDQSKVDDSLLVIDNKKQQKPSVNFLIVKRNPAESYFFSRKYKISSRNIAFFSENTFKTIDNKYLNTYKALIDSIPEKHVLSKKNMGNPTVMIDIPDWEMQLFLSDGDTLNWFSGGLPNDMKGYNTIVWSLLERLDGVDEL